MLHLNTLTIVKLNHTYKIFEIQFQCWLLTNQQNYKILQLLLVFTIVLVSPVYIYLIFISFSCCTATSKQPDTCTNPALQNQQIGLIDCPYPPSISISDFANGSTPSGPLDDINVYVAEQILIVSSQFNIYDFLVRFQVMVKTKHT